VWSIAEIIPRPREVTQGLRLQIPKVSCGGTGPEITGGSAGRTNTLHAASNGGQYRTTEFGQSHPASRSSPSAPSECVVSDSFHKRPPSILAFVVLGRKYASKTLVWSIAAKVIPGTCPADSVYSADSAGLASFSLLYDLLGLER